MLARLFLVLFTASNLAASGALAAPGDLLLTIPNPVPRDGAWFGWSVAPLGSNIIVSSGGGMFENRTRGRVFLIDGATGEAIFEVTPSQSGNYFGFDVAAAGDNIAVSQEGAAYVFDGGTGQPLLTIPLGHSNDWNVLEFAGGNLLVAGSPDFDNLLINGTTGEVIRRLPTNGVYYASLAVLGDDFVMGPQGTFGATEPDVKVVDSQTGEYLLTIADPASQEHSSFGNAVAVIGNHILVGAPHCEVDGIEGAGCVYLFDGGTGELKLTIPNPTPVRNEEFGANVAGLEGHIAVALDQDVGTSTIELFDSHTGQFATSIEGPFRSAFGATYVGSGAMAAMNGHLLASSINVAVGEFDAAGAVYLFEGFPAPAQPGDTDADGVVDLEDLNNVRNNFGASGLGDTNADGLVDLVDLNNVRNHFGETASGAASVPEPSSAALAFIMVLAVAACAWRWWGRPWVASPAAPTHGY